ncbi:MAG: hypothetical protein M1834_009084 [Cirrosporium novae-zelandiae]|nr:MAG: hypothetical protein M1834_009084 [Cirrosporium novae-zelandiae]
MEFCGTENDVITVMEIFAGIEDDCEMSLLYHNIRFIIALKRPTTNPLDNDTSIESTLLQNLDIAASDPDELVFDRCLEDVRDLAISKCKNMMNELAPPIGQQDAGAEARLQSLEEMIHPETFVLQLVTVKGELAPCLLGGRGKGCVLLHHHGLPTINENDGDGDDVEVVPATEITVLENLLFQKVVKVSWKNEVCIFKSASVEGKSQLIREIHVLRTLEEVRRAGDGDGGENNDNVRLHIPHFLGLVKSHKSNGIIGFLEEYIPSSQNLDNDIINTPSSSENNNTPIPSLSEKKTKWLNQISESIFFLHKNNLVWGDAKAQNVLVDGKGEGDAWLVDFGGSWTQGWVDAEVAETVEGDLQGLRRIREVLGLGGGMES